MQTKEIKALVVQLCTTNNLLAAATYNNKHKTMRTLKFEVCKMTDSFTKHNKLTCTLEELHANNALVRATITSIVATLKTQLPQALNIACNITEDTYTYSIRVSVTL